VNEVIQAEKDKCCMISLTRNPKKQISETLATIGQECRGKGGERLID
jgi:hypothetical protein